MDGVVLYALRYVSSVFDAVSLKMPRQPRGCPAYPRARRDSVASPVTTVRGPGWKHEHVLGLFVWDCNASWKSRGGTRGLNPSCLCSPCYAALIDALTNFFCSQGRMAVDEARDKTQLHAFYRSVRPDAKHEERAVWLLNCRLADLHRRRWVHRKCKLSCV
jgi:hypothetical protein